MGILAARRIMRVTKEAVLVVLFASLVCGIPVPGPPRVVRSPQQITQEVLLTPSLELGPHPLQRFCFGDLVCKAPLSTLPLLAGNTEARTAQHNIEVHPVNASVRVVLQTQIDVLVHTEAEVACGTEVALADLVVGDLEATIDQIEGLLATNGHVGRDLFVPTDTEGTDGVPRFVLHRLLVRELLEHTDGLGQPVSSLSDSNVDDELVDFDLAHHVVLTPHTGDGATPM